MLIEGRFRINLQIRLHVFHSVCADQSEMLTYTVCYHSKFKVTTTFFFSFLKEIKTFIQQGYIKLIKSDSKDICSVTKERITNHWHWYIAKFMIKSVIKYGMNVAIYQCQRFFTILDTIDLLLNMLLLAIWKAKH